MTTPRRSSRTWLLSVASAGALFPSCAKQHDENDDDSCTPTAEISCSIVVGVVPYPDAGAQPSTAYPDAATGLVASPDAASARPDGAQPLGMNVVPDAGPDAGCPENLQRGPSGGCIPLGILIQFE